MTQKPALRERKFHTKTARLICQRIYGHPIVDSTWASWRKCVGIPKKVHWVTGEQLLEISTIAYLRRDIKRRQLAYEEVKQAEIDVSNLLMQTIEAIDHELVLGADVQDFLREFACRAPSRATLYRRISRFSQKKYYPKSLILQVA